VAQKTRAQIFHDAIPGIAKELTSPRKRTHNPHHPKNTSSARAAWQEIARNPALRKNYTRQSNRMSADCEDFVICLSRVSAETYLIGTVSLEKWLAKDYWLWLGRQSYSLYLIHVPVVMVTVILYGGKVPLLASLSVIPVSITLAQIFHLNV
jgi:hypothetical protein